MPFQTEPTAYHIMNGYQCLRNIPRQTNDLYLVHCGIEKCSPGQSYGPRSRHEYHLHFILDGGGTFQINGMSYHLTKGQLFLLPPGIETFYFGKKKKSLVLYMGIFQRRNGCTLPAAMWFSK